jgi:enoyl-CoA hydratase
MAPTEGKVTLARDGDVAVLTVSRPGKKNSLTPAMLGELEGAVASLRSGPVPRVLVVRGEGEEAFFAGVDLATLEGLDPLRARAFAQRGGELLLALENLPLPVIAAVRGHCLGGGLELALACDFIVAAEGSRFGLPEAGFGFTPGWGGCIRLPRRVGLGRAKEMILTSRAIGATEALAVGLVEAVYPAEEFEPRLAALVADLAAKAPLALSLAKSVVLRGLDASLETGLALEREAFALVFTTEDAKEGVRAFFARRPPRFTGK